jgi:hypothetical protein
MSSLRMRKPVKIALTVDVTSRIKYLESKLESIEDETLFYSICEQIEILQADLIRPATPGRRI